MTSGKENNHFADAENNVQMFRDAFCPAVERRRVMLGLDRSQRACFLYDAFTGFEAATSAVRRLLLFEDYNCSTIQGDGKWSVHGSPCDGNHAYFRKLNDLAEDVAFGFADDPWLRDQLINIVGGDKDGLPYKDCNNLEDVT